MATTYCVRADVDFVMSNHGVNAAIDDNIDGAVSPTTETGFITDAIEIAADDMNAKIEQRYKLSELSSNTWCKWANSRLAAAALMTRRGNPLPPSLADQVQQVEDMLDGILAGNRKIPNQNDSFDTLPAVSNYLPQRAASRTSPIKVDTQTSTREAPPTPIKRESGTVHTWPR